MYVLMQWTWCLHRYTLQCGLCATECPYLDSSSSPSSFFGSVKAKDRDEHSQIDESIPNQNHCGLFVGCVYSFFYFALAKYIYKLMSVINIFVDFFVPLYISLHLCLILSFCRLRLHRPADFYFSLIFASPLFSDGRL